MRAFVLVTAAGLSVLLGACGSDSSGPESLNVTGTFIGSYTTTLMPGTVYEGVAQLTQSGTQVTGTLTTNAGRSATVTMTLSGSRLTGTLVFTDQCGGQASTTADVVNSGRRLTGNYQATDCLGSYAGGYALDKQ